VPAVNGHGTARGAAGLYAALLQGKLVSAALLGEATAAQCSGMDAVIGQDTAWGLGFGVGTDGFGMGGSGGSYAGASTLGGYAFAFVTARMGSHARATAVENAFRGCIGVPPLDDLAAAIQVNWRPAAPELGRAAEAAAEQAAAATLALISGRDWLTPPAARAAQGGCGVIGCRLGLPRGV